MKLTTLSLGFLCAAGSLVLAIPAYKATNASEADAIIQINKWQEQYNRYIEGTVKNRHTGCTSKNIVKRQEWYVSL